MIERIENAIQITVLLICAGISIFKTAKYRSRTWTNAFFFFGSLALGDIYWFVCLIFYGKTPQISVVSDLSWYASYIFLYLILTRTAPPEETGKAGFLPWLGPVFTVSMALFFMTYGEILGNIICASLMGLLLFSSIRRLKDHKRCRKELFLAVMIFIFCMIEYGLWLSSCFWSSDTLANPYYWFDFLLTVCFVILVPAIKKAVEL
ncbi:MAG: hypothetical protein J5950_05830 [Clostridia bacterium]|nr:hypothetical protein [Clostridia bacterium]